MTSAVTPINPVSGGSTPSVLANDSLNGTTPPAAADVLLTLDGRAGRAGHHRRRRGDRGGRYRGRGEEPDLPAVRGSGTGQLRHRHDPPAGGAVGVDDALSTPAGQVLNSRWPATTTCRSVRASRWWAPRRTGLVLAADGSLTYTPPAGFSGAVHLRLQVCLPAPDAGVCATATATLNVNSGTLVAVDDTFRHPDRAGRAVAERAGQRHPQRQPRRWPPRWCCRWSARRPVSAIAADGTISVSAGTAVRCDHAHLPDLRGRRVDQLRHRQRRPDRRPGTGQRRLRRAGRADRRLATSSPTTTCRSARSTRCRARCRPGCTLQRRWQLQLCTAGRHDQPGQLRLPRLPACTERAVCGTATVTLNINNGPLVANDDSFGRDCAGRSTPSVLGNDALNGVSPPAAGECVAVAGRCADRLHHQPQRYGSGGRQRAHRCRSRWSTSSAKPRPPTTATPPASRWWCARPRWTT